MNTSLRATLVASAVVAGAALAACGPPKASGIQACPDAGGRTVQVTVSTHNPCPVGGWVVDNPASGGAGSQNFPCGNGLARKAEDDGCVSFVENFVVSATDRRIGHTVLVTGPGWMTTPFAAGALHWSSGIKPVDG